MLFEKSSISNLNDLLATAPTSVQTKEGMTPHFKSGRDGSVAYFIDGNRVYGSYGLPKSAIEEMSVTLGGIPAQYGDLTSAVIEIETRSGLVNHHKK